MGNEIKSDLKTDNLGRYILDLQTPVEKTIGRAIGCFGIILLFLVPFFLSSIFQGEFGIISKSFRLIGFFLVIGFFYFCRKSVDCYYVLDTVGGQLLYHFSAILMVSEDPIVNIENIVGVGVTYAGYQSFAVVIACDNGKTIRISDFLNCNQANNVATNISDLLDVHLICAEPNEEPSIIVENGWMIKKTDKKFLSSVDKDTTSGCLASIFLAPYLTIPVMIFLMISFAIVTGKTEIKDLAYYLKDRKYDVVNADGKKVTFKDIKKSTPKVVLNTPNNKTSSKIGLHKTAINAAGTIVPGKGIVELVELNEPMEVVFKRFKLELPPQPAEVPNIKPGYDRRTKKYIQPRTHRQDFLDGKLSVVFTANRNNQMTVSRIEIFKGQKLPYATGDNVGFSASAKLLFGLGDGNGNLKRNEGESVHRKFPGASFFTTSRRVGNNFEQGYGVSFAKEGIDYTFYGDNLYEISITEKKR